MYPFISTCDEQEVKTSRTVIVSIIYISLLLDNVLLTVIVPILPDFLIKNESNELSTSSLIYKKYDLELVPSIILAGGNLTEVGEGLIKDLPKVSRIETALGDENVLIGILLSVKAFVQLLCNPLVGHWSKQLGYELPIVFGTISLVFSSFLFAVGENYYSLLLARAVQGIGSSCIGVCGMSLVAQLYPEDAKRSKVMGIVLGSIALGVLIGYPVGGILYDFVGKSSPFIIILFLLLITLVLQFCNLELNRPTGVTVKFEVQTVDKNWWQLSTDPEILLTTLAIWISTSAMAILEPCLPLWLLENLQPEKWQLGTVFIPDSFGYLIGTNCFGKFAYDMGQIRVAVSALILIGISCILIPTADCMLELLLPHFGLGLGIGVLDASLVPYLSTQIDRKYSTDLETASGSMDFHSNYGTVYAIQQMAVSLAYSVSPLLGSELAKQIGFPVLMVALGVINLIYGPVFYYLSTKFSLKMGYSSKSKDCLLAEHGTSYKRFYSSTN